MTSSILARRSRGRGIVGYLLGVSVTSNTWLEAPV